METSQEQQRTTFNDREDLYRSSPVGNYGDLTLANQQSDTYMQEVPNIIKQDYANSITVSHESEGQGIGERFFPYTNMLSAATISQGAVDADDTDALTHNVDISPQMDQIQNSAQEWQPSPVSSSHTQKTHIESDDNLKLSKDLSNSMPNMYY